MILDATDFSIGDIIYSENPDWKGEGFIHQVNCLTGWEDEKRPDTDTTVLYEFLSRDEPEFLLEIDYSLSIDMLGLHIAMVRIADYQVKCLSPVMSQHDQNMYRVILKQMDKGYEVHVGDDFIRMFPNYRNLPKEVKEKLGIVYSKFPNPQDDDTLKRMSVSAYINSDEEMQAIGWRVSKSWTCLVLTEKTLNSLRGEKQNDSGRKGESEG